MKSNHLKIKSFFFVVALMLFCHITSLAQSNDSILFNEGFEEGVLPEGWSLEYEKGTKDWKYQDGGFSLNPDLEGTGHPPYAYQGTKNALFHIESFNGEKTKLITPPLDLSFALKPELIFYHAQDERYTFGDYRNDELRIYYREAPDSSWKLLKGYTEVIESWTRAGLLIPNEVLSSSYQIAFEGKTNNGYGVALDSVVVMETGLRSKYVENINVYQPTKKFVATESNRNKILQINFEVKGNDGNVILDSLAFNSLNTDDSDIKENGVKIFASKDTLFKNSEQIHPGINFHNRRATFDNLNYAIPRGFSSIWLTYDIKKDTEHELQGHTLDAKIAANSMKINESYYPLLEKSPHGEREIYESIFFDNFEADNNWTLTGEFEREKPNGLGGSYGTSDPYNAVSGDIIIGTDLTGLGSYPGDFEPSVSDRGYQAITPYFNCKYYKDIYIFFDRYLNTTDDDHVYIDVSADSSNWENIWENQGFINTNEWLKGVNYNISEFAEREDSLWLRFALGKTNTYWNLSGWNIDNFVLTGDYIAQDVGVINWITPTSGCGHTENENVTVVIRNFGGEPSNDTIPILYSVDGGTNIYRDTIFQKIPVEDSIFHTFEPTVDITSPGWYKNVWAKTSLPEDEGPENNQYDTSLFVVPTYHPPYKENFENNNGYFRTNRKQSIWEYGVPEGSSIDTAASGTKVWATQLKDIYLELDSTYLETPCFNLSNIEHPIFEFKLYSELQKDKDGLALYYSIDGGITWNLIPRTELFNWNWYNSQDIEALGTAGWDTTTNSWMEVKEFLPPEIIGQSSVKFRFVFASDSTVEYEGVAIDDIKIYEAPPDVGVVSMEYPTTQCYLSDSVRPEVYIKNTGIDTLFAGREVPLRLKVNEEPLLKDTLELTEYLTPGDSILFTFNRGIDMSDSGDYAIKIYSVLEEDPYFYDTINNDTLTDTVAVQGMPNYDIGHVIGMPAPVDTVLDAGAGFASYQWSGKNNVLGTSQTYHVNDTTGWFYVEVINDTGCMADDSVKVVDSDINTGVTDILTTLSDSCVRNKPVGLQVEISNMGIRNFQTGDSIPMAYEVNHSKPVRDTLWLQNPVNSSETVNFTFAKSIDMSKPGSYTLSVYTSFPEDYQPGNDTMQTTVNTWGTPDTKLTYDTLLTANADSLTLDAGSAFDTYNYTWQDGSANQTYDINHNRSAWYKVTVGSVHGCGTDSDSTRIIAHDIGIDSLVSPLSACPSEHASSMQAMVRITNYSADTLYPAETIPMALMIDSTIHRDTIVLGSRLEPNSTRDFTLSPVFDISTAGSYQFEVYPESSFDADRSNDTLRKTIETWSLPDTEIARDTIYTTEADTINLTAGEGFGSYLWQDGSTSETYEITENISREYSVTVTDVHGCGEDSDSVQVFTYNMGIKEMAGPSSDCELGNSENIRVKVKNYSLDTLYSGETIDLVYILDEKDTVRDSKTFTEDLKPRETFTHTFSETVDMSEFRTYQFKFFTDHPYDADRSNDTLLDAVKTYGYPEFSLNYDTVYTTRADTVKLYPDILENAYLWNTGSNNDTLYVSDNSSREYKLTVSDIHGCSSVDSSMIFTYNLGVKDILSPANQCELTEHETLSVEIKNYGSDTLQTGTSIPVEYQINDDVVVSEAHELNNPLHPDSTVVHNFTGLLDMSLPGTYNFRVSTGYKNDADHSNDTITRKISHYGYPQIDLGPDTIYTAQADTLKLEAQNGYADYLWQDGSKGRVFNVKSNKSQLYHVKVENEHGCYSMDSVMVVVPYDVETLAITSPENACSLGDAEQVTAKFYNNSNATIADGEQLPLTLVSPDDVHYKDVIILTSSFKPGDTLTYTFSRSLDLSTANQSYTIKAYAAFEADMKAENDTVTKSIEVYGLPQPDLGSDTTVNAAHYELDPGKFAEYQWHNDSQNRSFILGSDNITQDKLYHVTVTDQNGCTASDTAQVDLNVKDIEIKKILSPGDHCVNEKASVEFSIVNSGTISIPQGTEFPVSYRIDDNQTTEDVMKLTEELSPEQILSFSFSENFTPEDKDSYTLQLDLEYEDDMLPGNNDTSATYEIFPAPQVDLGKDTVETEIPYTLDPGEYHSYLWQDNSTERTYEVTESGTYSVTVSNEYGCEASDNITIVATGLEDRINPSGDYEAKIYPVPATEHILIDLSSDQRREYTIRLINTQGYSVYIEKTTLRNGTVRIHAQSLPRGIYYLRIEEESGIQTYKVILK